MTIVDHVFEAKCPPAALWAVLADLGAVAHYNPTISAARVRGSRRTGSGAERECDLFPKGRIVERVSQWDEGRAMGIELVESDWPLDYMRWVTRIEPRGTASLVTQRLEYKVKFGPVGFILDRLVMRRRITENVGAALQGFIRWAESHS